MQYYRFLKHSEAIEVLLNRIDCFEMVETDGSAWVYIPLASLAEAEETLVANPIFVRFEEVHVKDYVDWGVQWSTHCPDFKDYTLRVDLSKYAQEKKSTPTLQLHAGPGFGDLSHPTTRLTLEMMAPHVKDKEVVDVGCGSGILTLSAILLGARKAIGIDIDSGALTHATQNAELNKLENTTIFLKPEQYTEHPKKGSVILLNMIRTEQQVAWASLPQLHQISGECFASGILTFEKEIYLKECEERGWALVEERIQGDWMAFHFLTGDISSTR